MSERVAGLQYRELVAELERLAIDLATLEIRARHEADLSVDQLSDLVDRVLALHEKHRAHFTDEDSNERPLDDSDQPGALRRVWH